MGTFKLCVWLFSWAFYSYHCTLVIRMKNFFELLGVLFVIAAGDLFLRHKFNVDTSLCLLLVFGFVYCRYQKLRDKNGR